MSRDENIQYCKQCVEIFNDYRYVKWDNMEDYQIEHWVMYFKKELKLKGGNIYPMRRKTK